MSQARPITAQHARQFIISKQALDASPKPALLDLIKQLGCVQLDPIRRVERTHLLVLWSRLGDFDLDELEHLRWDDKSVFEYWAHAASIVPTEDFPIHEVNMRYSAESDRFHKFMDEHDLHALRERMLAKMGKEGAHGTNDFDEDQMTGETFNGWSTGRAVNRLMDRLWTNGDVLPAQRVGNQRKWALRDDVLPDWTPRESLTDFEASYQSVQRAVKGLGVAMGKKHINYHFTRGRYYEFKAVWQKLHDDGVLIPVQIQDSDDVWAGEWVMLHDDLPLLERIEAGEWQGRTTLLSPFDNLICDRDRTEHIWDFRYRVEIYVPADKREFGYYVLPILHHDKLIGRMDMTMDRKTDTLHIHSTYAESHATTDATTDIRQAVHELADFLGATTLEFGTELPTMWRGIKK